MPKETTPAPGLKRGEQDKVQLAVDAPHNPK